MSHHTAARGRRPYPHPPPPSRGRTIELTHTALLLAVLALILAACTSEAGTAVPTPTEALPTIAPSAIETGTSEPTLPLMYTYDVQPGDSLEAIATRFGVSPAAVRGSNLEALGLVADAQPAPGTTLRIPTLEGILHTVEAGETVASIAARYGVTADVITGFPANSLEPGDDLEDGDIVLVPGA